jgi:hypothetical protein
MCAACSATAWRMVPTLPAELEIRRRISRIADNSLASRAASDSWLAADELRGRVVSARLRPFRVAAFRRRDLIDAAPGLERRVIALPWLNRTHHSGLGRIVQHSKFDSPTSGVGQNAKPLRSGLCQLPPAADITPMRRRAKISFIADHSSGTAAAQVTTGNLAPIRSMRIGTTSPAQAS